MSEAHEQGEPKTLGAEMLVATLEGILFAADRPMTVDELRAAIDLESVNRRTISLALGRLLERHADGPGRGFVLVETGDRYQFRTTARVTEAVARSSGLRPVRLSRAALETLSIVAYKQPVTRGEVERVRGVDSGGVLRALLDRRLLRIAGRRDEPGRPIIYGTAPRFLETFGLGSLADLPSLREFAQLGEEDLEAAEGLLEGEDGKQITFDEYAVRQALGGLDEAVDRKLAAAGKEAP